MKRRSSSRLESVRKTGSFTRSKTRVQATSKITASPSLYSEWKREVKSMAEAYLSELKKYLDDNSGDYSEYTTDDAAENDTPAYDTIVVNPNSTGSVMI
jgi:hypothetical protein